MNQRDRLLKVVEQDVRDDLAGFARLYESMERLQGALMAREVVAITEVNGDIAGLMDAAGARARRRSKVLEVLGLGADANAMESLIGLYEPARRGLVSRAWKTLIGDVERCRGLNERNGRLLAMHSEIFRQLARQDSTQLYSPSL